MVGPMHETGIQGTLNGALCSQMPISIPPVRA